MKKIMLLFFLVAIIPVSNAIAQTRWIEDTEMGFKIAIPANYQTNMFKEGNDKIHAFVSPDQNVAIRVRSFKISDNTTLELVMKSFTQGIIKGAQQLINQPYTLNGMNGRLAGYKWKYNNINVIAGAFYTIQNGVAYIVWTLIPENLFVQRNSESDAITNSFKVLSQSSLISNNSGGLGNMGGLGTTGGLGTADATINQPETNKVEVQTPPVQIQITDALVGGEIDSNFRIKNLQDKITTSTNRINMVFGYNGNAKGQTFNTRWYKTNQNILINEFPFFPPDSPSGRGYAYINNLGESLEAGNYRVEIFLNEQFLKEVNFAISEPEITRKEEIVAVAGYTVFVSDDACLEHLIAEKATLRKGEQGQKIWDIPIGSTGKNVTMVMQNITKQGRDFKTFITEQINAIKSKGAAVRSQDFGSVNGLSVCNYWYEYNGTMFLYTAADGPNSFYLLGFVGSIDYEGDVRKYYEPIHTSITKSPCGNPSEN